MPCSNSNLDLAARAQPPRGRAPWPAPRGAAIRLATALLWALSAHPADITLTDVTGQTGITWRHTDGSSGRRYIMETVSAGLALFDYDNDGDVDLYFLNGAPLPGAPTTNPPPANALYRNDGGWHFTDVTRQAGVGDTGYGLGVAVGDYDNDGDPDLYLNNYGPNVFYRNNGDGTFTDVTRQTGTANGRRTGAGAAFLDADGDGDLDLYVANYVQFSEERHTIGRMRGAPVYVGPTHYPADPDTFYLNNGDGTFTDASETSGIAAHAGFGMGLVAADYDDDGDTDVFVANDLCENYLFRNDGRAHFEEVALMAGVGYDASGDEQGSMGVDCGDFDNDGRLDFYQTSFQGQLALLFHNLGGGFFEEVTLRTGAGQGTFPNVTWGCGLVDFDNDGHRDLFVACGHLQDNVEQFDDTTRYRARNLLLRNRGNGTFENVSDRAGSGLAVRLSSRGAGFDDLDNDGDVDVVVLNSRAAPTLLRNDTPAEGRHWLELRLRGRRANRDGVGARVRVTAGGVAQVAEVHAGRGYQSHYGTRLHYGLGASAVAERIEVRWPGGGTEVWKDVPADQRLVLTEGGGSPVGAAKAP